MGFLHRPVTGFCPEVLGSEYVWIESIVATSCKITSGLVPTVLRSEQYVAIMSPVWLLAENRLDILVDYCGYMLLCVCVAGAHSPAEASHCTALTYERFVPQSTTEQNLSSGPQRCLHSIKNNKLHTSTHFVVFIFCGFVSTVVNAYWTLLSDHC